MSASPQDSCPSCSDAETFRRVPLTAVSICSKKHALLSHRRRTCWAPASMWGAWPWFSSPWRCASSASSEEVPKDARVPGFTEIKYGMELNIGTGTYARLRRSQLETDSSCEDAGFSCLALRNNPHAGILGVKPISALVARPSSVTSRLSCTTADPKGDCWEGSVTPPIETKEICFWRAHDEW